MGHPLLKAGIRANLCFHDISDDHASPYTVPARRLTAVADGLRDLGVSQRVRMYFDDGYASLPEAVERLRSDYPEIQLVAALTLAFLDTPGFISRAEVPRLYQRGVAISAHGREHVHFDQLDEREIAEQLHACAAAFSRYGTGELVLPYGTYDGRVVAVNRRERLFSHLTTVDYAWDVGQELRPRLVVTADLLTSDVCVRLGRPA